MPVLVGLWELWLQQGCLHPSPMLLPFPFHFSSSALEAVPLSVTASRAAPFWAEQGNGAKLEEWPAVACQKDKQKR